MHHPEEPECRRVRRRRGPLGAWLLVAGLLALEAAGCGSAAAPSSAPGGGTAAGGSTITVSGQVIRSCGGPLIRGRPRRCSDVAEFAGPGGRRAVRGRFSISLKPGRYRISVGICIDQQTLVVTRTIAGLRLLARCPQPL